MISDSSILTAYYMKWADPDHSIVKTGAVIADVKKCWRARTRKGRLAAFYKWGDPAQAVTYWMRVKRTVREVTR